MATRQAPEGRPVRQQAVPPQRTQSQHTPEAPQRAPKPPGPGALAWWALGFGIFAVTAMWGTILGAANPPDSGFDFGRNMVIAALSVNTSGLVLGILALALPGHGHGQRPRRNVAWTAIGLSLVSFAGLGLILLAV